MLRDVDISCQVWTGVLPLTWAHISSSCPSIHNPSWAVSFAHTAQADPYSLKSNSWPWEFTDHLPGVGYNLKDWLQLCQQSQTSACHPQMAKSPLPRLIKKKNSASSCPFLAFTLRIEQEPLQNCKRWLPWLHQSRCSNWSQQWKQWAATGSWPVPHDWCHLIWHISSDNLSLEVKRFQ